MFPFNPSSSQYHEDSRDASPKVTGEPSKTTASDNNTSQDKDNQTKTTNKWVGAVLPNILDYYDNPTYTATLYMISPTENNTSASTPDTDETITDGSAKRSDQSSGDTKKTGGGFLNGAMTASPENSVILAKTGATAGVTIDNIELTTVSGGPTGAIGKTCTFEIIQPGAASFIDMMVRAQKYLGIPTATKDFPLFLEINFIGRTEKDGRSENYGNDYDPDTGGRIRPYIKGPFLYKLHLKNFSINIDQTGSRYDFETVVASELAYKNGIYTLPVLMTTTGSTITEHIKGPNGLEKLLNDELTKCESGAIPDRVEFDLSGLISADAKSIDKFSLGANLDKLGRAADTVNDIINTPNPADRLAKGQRLLASDLKDQSKKQSGISSNLIIDETLTTTETTVKQKIPGLEDIDKPDPEQIDKILEENKSSGAVTKKDSGKIEVIARRGLTIENYFQILLSMNDEFFTKSSRIRNPGDFFIKEDPNKINTAKFKLNAEVVDLEYNAVRRTYVKKVIFKPTIYFTPEKTFVTSEGALPDSGTVAKERIKQYNIQKAYHYIFTGRNDQIVNLDINYNNGYEFLIPVNGGYVGDPSLNTRHSSAEPVPQNENSNPISEILDAVSKVKEVKNIFNLFKGKDDVLGSIAGVLGFDSNTAKSFLSDGNSASARAFADALSNKLTRESISNLLLNKKSPNEQTGTSTESDQQNSTVSGEKYTPTPSGYVYGADLLGGTKHAEDLVKKELQKRTEENVANDESEVSCSSAVPTTNADFSSSELTVGGQKNNRNTIMQYLFQQQSSGRFLVDLDMTIRGDPWYLGQTMDKPFETNESKEGSDTTVSDSDGVSTARNDNFILLEINSPRYFDLDVTDEDNNTGKWYKDGEESTAYFFSGVYRLLTATNRFQNGFYTVDIVAKKETAIDLSQLKPMVDYSGLTLEESEFLKSRQQANQEVEDNANKVKTPQWINGYLSGENTIAGVRDGEPVTIDTLLSRGIINSEEASAWRSWKAEQDRKGGS